MLARQNQIGEQHNPRIRLQKSNRTLFLKIDSSKMPLVILITPLFLSITCIIRLINNILTCNSNEIFSLVLILILFLFPLLAIGCYGIQETYLEINPEIFTITRTYLFIWKQEVQGKTQDILKISDNENKCTLWEQTKSHEIIGSPQIRGVSDKITVREIKWIVAEIFEFIKQLELDS